MLAGLSLAISSSTPVQIGPHQCTCTLLLLSRRSPIFVFRYQLPGRKYFRTKAIPSLYAEVSDRVRAQLEGTEWYSATTDMWTSITQDPYMAFTVHYLDVDWNLQAIMLQVTMHSSSLCSVTVALVIPLTACSCLLLLFRSSS